MPLQMFHLCLAVSSLLSVDADAFADVPPLSCCLSSLAVDADAFAVDAEAFADSLYSVSFETTLLCGFFLMRLFLFVP